MFHLAASRASATSKVLHVPVRERRKPTPAPAESFTAAICDVDRRRFAGEDRRRELLDEENVSSGRLVAGAL